ncbi:MAG: Ig-like domain-containing protein, partial [Pseudomonadota bacterium]
MTLVITSSNTGLLPVSGITLTPGTGATSTTVGATANYSLAFAPLANQLGSSTVTVTATDNLGGTSSRTFTFTVQSVPAPVISTWGSDTGSSSSDGITSDNTISLSGTASYVAGATVEIFDGTTSLGTATVNANGTWSFTTTAAQTADGAHNYTVKLSQPGLGTSQASNAIAVTVDTAAPGAPVLTGISLDTGSSNSDKITSDNTIDLTGTAEAGSTVKIYDNGTLVGTVVANASGIWTLPSTGTLADGAHAFTFTATDTAGNTSVVGSSTVTIDTSTPAVPTITMVGDDTGSSATDGITKDSTLTVKGAAEPGVTVTLYNGSTVLGSAVADANGNYIIVTSTLADGSYNLSVQASDAAGNTSAGSAAVAIVIDTITPSAPAISGPASSNSNTPAITGTAEANSVVSVYDGATLLGTALADARGAWTFTPTSSLSEGSHSITATATDVAGNTSLASSASSLVVDSTPPAIGFAAVTGDNKINLAEKNAGVVLTGSVEAGVTSVVVTYLDTNSQTVSVNATVSGTTWSYALTSTDWTNIGSAPSKKFTATATDAGGNTASKSQTPSINLSSLAQPGDPLLNPASDSGTQGDGITSATTVLIDVALPPS